MKRIPTLDGWRGIAILLVLISHGAIGLRGVFHLPHDESIGQHGVALFFVLSGFLITSLLLREQEEGAMDLRRFYLRRFFRLMPCAWLFLALVAMLALEKYGWPVTAKELLASIFFFRNYVDTAGIHPITGHFWSLSIEEQFYLVWPSILLFAGARRARWISLAGACSVAIFRYFCWAQLSTQTLQASFATQYRADALLIGCAAALWLPVIKPRLRIWMIYPALVALAACVAHYQRMIPLLESSVVASLLLLTSSFANAKGAAWLDWKPLRILGKYSYSIYIWQQLFLFVVRSWSDLWIELLLLPACAFVSYNLIERPFREHGAKFAARLAARAALPNALGESVQS
jgi:peptidoglycan/LPS O-acetylase OafA/YrhL